MLGVARAHHTECDYTVMPSVIWVSHLWALLLLNGPLEPLVFIFLFHQGKERIECNLMSHKKADPMLLTCPLLTFQLMAIVMDAYQG